MADFITRIVGRIRPQSDGVSAQVPTGTLLGWYLRKGAIPAVRGLVTLPFLRSARLPLFVGSGARISYGKQLSVGRSVQIGAGVVLHAYSQQGVHLGDRVTIRENGWVQCTSHPASPGVGLWIAAGTYIGPKVTLGVGGPIRIGADCQIGANVTFIAENHAEGEDGPSAHDVIRRGITIGDNCWIGHGASILDGVTLGPRCVVGAGAVVTKSFPAGTRLAGVPARPLGGA